MKIINGHDYWDSAAAYGVDTTITFVRNSRKETPDFVSTDFFFPIIQYIEEKTEKTKILPLGAVLVAGKAYPFAFHTAFDPKSGRETVVDLTSIFTMYTIEDIVALHPSIGSGRGWYDDLEDLKYFFNQPIFNEKNVTDFLISHNSAIALVIPVKMSYGGWAWRDHGNTPKNEESKVWMNPSFLKDYHFYKIKDSFAMFMEVSNWVSGVLPNSIETVDISDKSKIVKAGFDIKSSFRKEKEK